MTNKMKTKFSIHCDIDNKSVTIILGNDTYQYNVESSDNYREGKQWSIKVGSKIEEFKFVAEVLEITTIVLRQMLADEYKDKLKFKKYDIYNRSTRINK